MKGIIEGLSPEDVRKEKISSFPEPSTIFGTSILIGGLVVFSLFYSFNSFKTGELNLKNQREYKKLENRIFRGENPLADLDSDGKINPLEKGLAYNSMGIESYDDKPTLEQLRSYVNWKESERNELQ